MKKFKLLALAIVLGTASLFANISESKVPVEEIRKQIVELVQVVDNQITDEVTVKITFTFNTKGEIVILKVKSKDKDVLSFIRENINDKKLARPGKEFKQYSMNLTIK